MQINVKFIPSQYHLVYYWDERNQILLTWEWKPLMDWDKLMDEVRK